MLILLSPGGQGQFDQRHHRHIDDSPPQHRLQTSGINSFYHQNGSGHPAMFEDLSYHALSGAGTKVRAGGVITVFDKRLMSISV
ncbi:hypothetical protein ACOMHN_006190 [Nucella lapillus]